MQQLPMWAVWAQWLATILIAGFAGYIGYRQWRTARERFVLDLFEKRMSFYEGVRAVVATVVSHGHADLEVVTQYDRAVDRMQLLFGDDVVRYLNGMRKTLLDYYSVGQMMETYTGDRRREAIERQGERFAKIAAFYTDFPPIFEPYVRMTAKLPKSWRTRLFGSLGPKPKH